jgi:hypothetical protein
MARTFRLMKSPHLHIGHVFGEVTRGLALLLTSDEESDLTPSEIEHRFTRLLECGF